jgi:peptidoglycan/LPS O-acetylase OafA/YrhL
MARRYNPALDGLRAVSILLVLACHANIPGLAAGSRGVDIFFVLSGFLITSIIRDGLAEGSFSPGAFWWRRFRRLMPALALMTAVYVALAPLLLSPDVAARRWTDAAAALLYLNDYVLPLGAPGGPLSTTWSLAIEEQFYLLWPLALPLVIRTGKPVLTLLALWLVLTITRLLTANITQSADWSYLTLHAHSSGLVLGAALALAPRLPRLGLIGIGLIAVSVMFAQNWENAVAWGITLTELGAAMVIAHIAQPSRLTSVLAFAPLRLLGLVSYGVYLWHYPIFAATGLTGWTGFFTVLAASIVLATASYLTIEKWVRRGGRARVAFAAAV